MMSNTTLNKDTDDRIEDPQRILTTSDAFMKVLELVGCYGRWQKQLLVIVTSCGIFTGMHNLGAAFLAAKPDHWCRIPSSSANASYARQIQNYTTPWVRGQRGSDVLSSCEYYVRENNSQDIIDTASCKQWFFDRSIYTSTVVSEWNLVCGRTWLMPTIQSTFMLGILFGAVFFSSISDKWGRRPSSIACVILFIASANLVPLSSSLEMFVFLRFLVAAAGQGIFLVVFVILMETVGKEGRTACGVLFHLGFTLGICLLSGIAYLVRDWRTLQICTSVPTLFLLAYWCILPESPRWLMIEGRYIESRQILRQIAKRNSMSELTDDAFQEIECVITKEREIPESTSCGQKVFSIYESMVALVRTPNMRRRNCVMFYAWFVTSMIYYGLSFNGANLNASVYLNVFLTGVIEIPFTYITIKMLERLGRRIGLIIVMLVGGICCSAIAFTPSNMVALNILLSTIGKGTSYSSFCIIFMYSAELVPTSVRNASIGMASMWARIGSAICPYIVDLLGSVYYAIPSLIFGISALICAALVLLLPETGNDELPESIDEIEMQKK